jgi:hypothetical protein
MIAPIRAGSPEFPIAETVAARSIIHTERLIPATDLSPELVVSVLERKDHEPGGPGVFSIHGGRLLGSILIAASVSGRRACRSSSGLTRRTKILT